MIRNALVENVHVPITHCDGVWSAVIVGNGLQVLLYETQGIINGEGTEAVLTGHVVIQLAGVPAGLAMVTGAMLTSAAGRAQLLPGSELIMSLACCALLGPF